MAKGNLALFESNLVRFIQKFVTMDETWRHHFQSESKEQSKQWTHQDLPPPEKQSQCCLLAR